MSSANDDRAVVRFRSVATTDERTEVRLTDNSVTPFGRGPGPIRFGHAPVADEELPRVVGSFIVAAGRVIVERRQNPTAAASAPQRALRVELPEGPPEFIVPGAAYSPPTPTFSIVVTGELEWVLDVAVRFDLANIDAYAEGGDPSGDPTRLVEIDLTEREWEVLRTYAAPVLAGGFEPATHEQAAEATNFGRSTVRRVLERIDDAFFAAGLWMPEVADSRVRVVTAARNNLLLAPPKGNATGAGPDTDST